MIKVNILVEGQTEETFVNEVLNPHFLSKGIYFTPILATTRPARLSKGANKGGITSFSRIEKDIQRLLYDSSAALVTTMIDYYGLAGKDFPGWDTMPKGSCYDRVRHLEQAFSEKINHRKFLPYLSLHEFEAMLFSAPEHIVKEFPDAKDDVLAEFEKIRNYVESPEEIDDISPPSKRILKLLPGYEKVVYGSIIALGIGLDTIRAECKHFDEWLTEVEKRCK